MDEQVVWGLQDDGHGRKEGQFRRKVPAQHRAQGRQLFLRAQREPRGTAHLADQAALAPHLQVVPVEGRSDLSVGAGEILHQIVAVAPQGVDRARPGQLHDVAQGGQAVRSLFHQIPHQHQNIVFPVARLVQHAPQEGQVAVDVADGQHPAVLGEVGMHYCRFSFHGSTSQLMWDWAYHFYFITCGGKCHHELPAKRGRGDPIRKAPSRF